MSINYNIETWMSSLRKMCIVSITQNILETARHDPSTMDNPKSIASKAAEMVPELNLPQPLTTEIIAIIRPVMMEMLRWYESYGKEVRVILTHHGTVDMTRSARAIVASDQPVYQRFVTACEHCLEDDIFTLGKHVTSIMLLEQSDPHADFWYNVYGGNFDVKIIGGSLSQEQVVEGCFLAGRHRNISAIRYFQEKATMKSIQVILDRTLDNGITLAILGNTCLLDNVLECEWLERRKGTISKCLLLQLIKWPYQHLFLESAELLMPNLSKYDFWQIVEKISKKLSTDYEEYDYKGLFVRFWNLGLMRFNSMLLDDTDLSTIEFLLENLFLVKDEFLVSLVFHQFLQMAKDYLYNSFNFNISSACFGLFQNEEYESVEFIMRLIQTKYQELFIKFQNAFNDKEIHASAYVYEWIDNQELDPIIVDKYVQFMSIYWVLPELELSGKNDLV